MSGIKSGLIPMHNPLSIMFLSCLIKNTFKVSHCMFKILQELKMLFSVTLYCQIAMIVKILNIIVKLVKKMYRPSGFSTIVKIGEKL